MAKKQVGSGSQRSAEEHHDGRKECNLGRVKKMSNIGTRDACKSGGIKERGILEAVKKQKVAERKR